MRAPDSGSLLRLAAAGVGAVRVGIPADAVVQAIPLPAALALLPRRQGALCGIVLHEGATVPVVDLARWVDVGSARDHGQAGARILVLRAGSRTIGLRVDTVDGLVEVEHGAVARLHHDDDPDEVFHSAAHVADTGHILSMLDVGRLADLAACWHVREDGAAPVQDAAPACAPEPARRDYALLQLDGLRLGVPATDLAEVMAMPVLTAFGGGIGGAHCLWRGRDLPVLAAGAIDGLPAAQSAPLLAVVEHEGLVLGLPMHAALALRALPPGLEGEPGAPTAAAHDDEGGALRLLDTAALFARFPEALLSRQQAQPPGASRPAAAGAATGTPNAGAYIVFAAGALAATPIAAVEQILALQAETSGQATMAWRGAAIRLVDLRPDAPAQAGAPGHVLVCSAGAEPVGYVVERVELLVPAGSGRLYRMGAARERALEFITVVGAAGEASYRIVDLAAA